MSRSEAAFPALFCSLFLLLFLWTKSDYGMTWDSAYGELYLGDKYYHFFKTLDFGYLDLDRDDIPIYHQKGHPDFHALSAMARGVPQGMWGLGHTLTAFTKDLFFTKWRLLDPIDAHYVALGPIAVLVLGALYLFALREFGFPAAAAALVALGTHPHFWAHAQNNSKDTPQVLFFTLVILAFYYGITTKRARLILLSAFLWGLALASKANAAFLAAILGPWLLYVLVERWRAGETPIAWREGGALLLYPLLGMGVFVIAWPWLLANLPDNLLAHIEYLRTRGWKGPPHWQREPALNLLTTTPLPVLLLSTLGLLSVARSSAVDSGRRSIHLLLLLWLAVPVLRVSAPGARDFDVIRHWMEVLVPLSILAGLGFQSLMTGVERIAAGAGHPRAALLTATWPVAALVLIANAPTIYWGVVNHPNQLPFYNRLIGGLSGAQARGLSQATDYWGSSYRQGIRWLNTHAPRDSFLFVGVAQHIVLHVRDIWLRPDLRFLVLAQRGAALRQLERGPPGSGTPVFVMYVTRRDWYPPLIEEIDRRFVPIHQIAVDGGPILKVMRLSLDEFGQLRALGTALPSGRRE